MLKILALPLDSKVRQFEKRLTETLKNAQKCYSLSCFGNLDDDRFAPFRVRAKKSGAGSLRVLLFRTPVSNQTCTSLPLCSSSDRSSVLDAKDRVDESWEQAHDELCTVTEASCCAQQCLCVCVWLCVRAC